MGTRSHTNVFGRFDKDDEWQHVCTIYRQMDGYPKWHGRDIKEILEGKNVVNGIGTNKTNILNGAECLAAYLVGKLKGDEPGSIYLQAPTEDAKGIDYVYDLFVDAGELIILVVRDPWDRTVIYDGPVDSFDPVETERRSASLGEDE